MTRTGMDLWPIVKCVDTDLARKITLFHVVTAGDTAFFVTSDDDVYRIRARVSADPDAEDVEIMKPYKIPLLCGKGIHAFAAGVMHILALSKDGVVYSWGNNSCGQLGTGNTTAATSPQLVKGLAEQTIDRIACGARHSVLCTTNGELYAFGYNEYGQCGLGSRTNQFEPQKITGALAGLRVASVDCGPNTTACLTDNGSIYTWGRNNFGQTDVLTSSHRVLSPASILPEISFTQIVCGTSHMLALSDGGRVYTWGTKWDDLKLEDECHWSAVTPTYAPASPSYYPTLPSYSPTSPSYAPLYNTRGQAPVELLMKPASGKDTVHRISSIAAHAASDTYCAKSLTGQVFVWGQLRGKKTVKTPMAVSLSDLHSVFAMMCPVRRTWRTVRCDDEGKLGRDLRAAMDDEETCDVKFMVEGRAINAHKTILSIRCAYFRAMFSAQWKESSQKEIEITDYSYAAFRAFIHYLYTDELNVSAELALELLDLAHARCEKKLKQMCEETLKENLNVENAFTYLSIADKYEAHELKETCSLFLVGHLSTAMQTDSFKQMDGDQAKVMLVDLGKRGAFKY